VLEYIPKQRRVGGLRLEPHKAMSTQQAIRPAFIPSRLIIPIDSRHGIAPRPAVAMGEHVLGGQVIAGTPSQSGVADIHASASGFVTAIEQRRIHSAQSEADTLCVVIKTDDQNQMLEKPNAGWPTDDARELLRCAGIVGLGGAAVSTAWKLAQAKSHHTLIINGAECEPYISCDDMLMREYADEIISGCIAITDLLRAQQCIIAIERDKPEAIKAMREFAESCADPRLRLAEIPSIYPAGGERQLVELLLDLEVPSGGYPSDLGVVCQNVGTARSVHRAIHHGTPLISRVVTVTGGGTQHPSNNDVLIGTPIEELIQHCGGYTASAAHLILGGSMMGVSQPDDAIPVTKATNCVIVAASSEFITTSKSWPCIRCGDCAAACPVRLQPQELHRAVQSADFDALTEFGLVDCIECGCCDVICPSHISLTSSFVDAKAEFDRRLSKEHIAQQAQIHFEARRDRLETLEQQETEQQAALVDQLGSEQDERQRLIAAAVKRARQRRRTPDDSK